MTRLRVVALAQALTTSMLLLPGPTPLGPVPIEAALRDAEADARTVYDAEGKGIGCQGGKPYRGPGLPKDPPWPPGAEPTPSPAPSPSPLPSAGPSVVPSPEPSAEPSTEPEAVLTRFASAETRLVQADAPGPSETTPLRKSDYLTGIDVSHHNGDIDYQAVKQAGHRFVFIKATQDNAFIDPMFPTNLARARTAGLAAGAYHFFDYTLDGRAQADHFIDRVEAADGIDGALPPVVDVECWGPIGPSTHAVSAARLRDFVERVYERTGVLPLVYTSVFMWREVVGNAEGFEDLPLWAACWGCEPPPSIAPGWDGWLFWQEGLTRIPGVGRLDGNYFSGRRKDLKALKTRPFAIEGGAAASDGGTVGLDFGGRTGTHFRISEDGDSWSAWQRHDRPPTAVIGTDEGTYTVYAQLRNGPGLTSPVMRDSVAVDRTPPQLSAPSVSLRTGAMGDGAASVPVSVRWQAHDDLAGLADAKVAVDCAEQAWSFEAPGRAEPGELADWDAQAWLVPGGACAITAIAADGAGNTERASAPGLAVELVPTDDSAEPVTLAGEELGIVAVRGPASGRAAVVLDGAAVSLVDLYAAEVGVPEVIHVLELTPGTHTVALEPTGSSDPASSGSTLTVAGYVTLVREGSSASD